MGHLLTNGMVQMGYVNENLMTGERIIYETRLHWIILFVPVAISGILFLFVGLWVSSGDVNGVVAISLIGGGVALSGEAIIRLLTSEFAVTDRRVMIKVGWLRRRTIETLLQKVENLGVEQSISGRLLGFGSLAVTGTGGTSEHFANIRSPLVFREHVQEQIATAQDTASHRVVLESAAGEATAGATRDERECPFCAETILLKAKVCKHCGRELDGQ